MALSRPRVPGTENEISTPLPRFIVNYNDCKFDCPLCTGNCIRRIHCCYACKPCILVDVLDGIVYHLCSVTEHIRPRKFKCESYIHKTTGWSTTSTDFRTGLTTYRRVENGDAVVFSANGSTAKLWPRIAADFPDRLLPSPFATAFDELRKRKWLKCLSKWSTPTRAHLRGISMDNGTLTEAVACIWLLMPVLENEEPVRIEFVIPHLKMLRLFTKYIAPLPSLSKKTALAILDELMHNYNVTDINVDATVKHFETFFVDTFAFSRALF